MEDALKRGFFSKNLLICQQFTKTLLTDREKTHNH